MKMHEVSVYYYHESEFFCGRDCIRVRRDALFIFGAVEPDALSCLRHLPCKAD